jgi:uncharacterized protein involved in outer membrane biogenesis
MKPATRKKLATILGVLVLLGIMVTLLLPRLIDPNQYDRRIVSELEGALGGRVSIGHITWGILKGIWLEVDGFEITGASAFPMDFRLSRIRASVSLFPLLKKKIVLSHLGLESPDVRLRLQPGPQKPTQERKPLPSGTKPAGIALPVEIEQLLVTKGKLRLEDSLTLPGKQLMREFGDIEIMATNLVPGQEMHFDISMKEKDVPGLGDLKAQGAFVGLTNSLTLQNPRLTVHAMLPSLHVDALKPYLGNAPWVQRLSGSLSLVINFEGDLESHNSAEGSIDISQVAFSDPSLWESALPGGETKMTYRASLQGDSLTVEDLEVKLGKLSLRARAGVLGLKERPVIKNAVFSADLLLRDLIPLVPWKLLGDSAAFLHPLFEGGGKVEIEQARFPPIDLTEPPATLEVLLPGIDLTSRISGVSLELSPGIPKITNIDARVHLQQGVASVQVLGAQFTTVNLPGISGKVTKLLGKPRVEAAVKGPLRVNKDPVEELGAFFLRCGLEEANGSADLNATVVVEISQPENVQVRGNIELRDVQAKTSLSPARLEGLHADLVITPDMANVTNLSTAVTVPAGASEPGGRFELQLEGRVDAWSRQPAITLQRIRTSPVALPVVASLVPWEKLGESAEPVKQTLLHGGSVTIEDVALPKIEVFNPPKSFTQLLRRTWAAAHFADLTVQPYSTLPGFEDVEGSIKLENGVLALTGARGRMGPLSLPDLTIRVTHMDEHPRVAVQAKGPVHLAATRDVEVEKLLKEYGLKSLAVSADIDMRADFDQAHPDDWSIGGSLTLADVRAETSPEAVVMDHLRGRVTVNRRKAMEITAEDITAQVNEAPVRLSGNLKGVGTPALLIDAKAYAKHLDLAHLREFFPVLKTLGLAGKLDMDLQVHLPYSATAKTRLNGMLATENVAFQIPAYHTTVKDVNTLFRLTGDTINIQRMQMLVNDQALAVAGQWAHPLDPKIRLVVTSPELNLDRLLPEQDPAKNASESSRKQETGSEKQTRKTELPPIARKMTAQLQVKADQGQYRGLRFQNLKFDALYDHGLIKPYDLDFGSEGGHLAAKGSVDLRDPQHAAFAVSPNIRSVKLETLASALGVHDFSVSGPISLSGQLQGKKGSSKDFLASLHGNLEIQIGPGKLARIGRGGEMLAKILSLISIRGILTGALFQNFASQGLPYQWINAQATLDNGNMDLTTFQFESNVMNVDAQGRINLLEEQMDMRVSLKPLGMVSTVMGIVPLIGKVAAGLTEIHFNLSGSLDDPRIFIIPGQGIAESIENEAKGVGSALKGAADLFGRDKDKGNKK